MGARDMTRRRLRVALIGCGQIAEAHLQEIRKISSAELVAVCDRHLELAQQAAARYDVVGVFDDLDQMLHEARPDVLHVTTPVQSHHGVALRALAAGVHAYVEKPFTVDATEAQEVLAVAQSSGRLVCVGHDQLYDSAWEECRQLYERRELGEVVHVDALMGYDWAGPFGKALLMDADHWVHRLPGTVFHNTISHALYKITDFLLDEEPQIWAVWFGEHGISRCPTELRVFLRGNRVTANLMFTSRVRPVQLVTRVYGTRQSIEVNLDGRLIRHMRCPAGSGPFVKLEIPWRHLWEAAASFGRNARRFWRAELHFFAGMNRLLRLFYQSILEGGEPPIPYGEIRRVTAIMDEIFRCCRKNQGLDPSPSNHDDTIDLPNYAVPTDVPS
jgi:predicted dehydrogenase